MPRVGVPEKIVLFILKSVSFSLRFSRTLPSFAGEEQTHFVCAHQRASRHRAFQPANGRETEYPLSVFLEDDIGVSGSSSVMRASLCLCWSWYSLADRALTLFLIMISMTLIFSGISAEWNLRAPTLFYLDHFETQTHPQSLLHHLQTAISESRMLPVSRRSLVFPPPSMTCFSNRFL